MYASFALGASARFTRQDDFRASALATTTTLPGAVNRRARRYTAETFRAKCSAGCFVSMCVWGESQVEGEVAVAVRELC